MFRPMACFLTPHKILCLDHELRLHHLWREPGGRRHLSESVGKVPRGVCAALPSCAEKAPLSKGGGATLLPKESGPFRNELFQATSGEVQSTVWLQIL